MPSKKSKKRLHCAISNDLYDFLNQYATKWGISMTAIVSMSIAEFKAKVEATGSYARLREVAEALRAEE